MVRQVMMLGTAAAIATVLGTPAVAHAQVLTCTPGTMPLVRAVGSPSAPMLVPAQVHVTICAQNGSVVAVIPAFRTLGPAGAPMIVPVQTNVKTCVPTTIATAPAVGSGLQPALQFVQVGSGVFAVNLGSTATPAVVTAVSTAFTCF